jgi:hypothetical protein
MAWEFNIGGEAEAPDVELAIKNEAQRFVDSLKQRFGENNVADGTFTMDEGEPQTLRRS